MISVAEASKIILNHSIKTGVERIDLERCPGRVLAEDIHADRDFPPFDRVTMDGVAISYDSIQLGSTSFQVEGIHTAGSEQISLANAGNCLEVMTGAILPLGADTVIRYEDVEINQGKATLLTRKVTKGQNIHRQGTDRKKSSLLIPGGTKISPAEIGVLATVGKSTVLVKKAPRTVILSTGDELVDITASPEPHQIRKSNIYNLKSALAEFAIEADLEHIADDMDETVRRIDAILETYDIIMLSGGVSKGKADYVPEALERCGVQKLFHRISQRPGKPFWFGARSEKVVFAFPGNPVSTFLCYQRYFRPWMRKSLQLSPEKPLYAVLSEDFSFKPDLTYFLQVKVRSDQATGQLIAEPVEGKGSGDLANLLESHAFLVLPPDKQHFAKGNVFELIKF